MAEWKKIEEAPKERIGPASYENHGPRVLIGKVGVSTVLIARWDWHRNCKTGNWKMDDGRVAWWTPDRWQPLPDPPKE